MLQRLMILLVLVIGVGYSDCCAQITGIKIAGDPCNDFTLTLQAEGTSSSPYFFWDFDDVASGTNNTVTITGASPSPNPVHTFSSVGVYNVCVSLQEPAQPVTTVCRSISIGLCCNAIVSSMDSCLQNGTAFTLVSDSAITSVSWDFGDPASGSGNTSSSLSPSHIFSAAGTYNVAATVVAPCGTYTATYSITVISCTPPICEGTISSIDTCLQTGTAFTLVSDSAITSVSWNFGDPASGTGNTSTSLSPNHVFSSIGNYTVSAVVLAPCGSYTVSFPITIINCTPPICEGTIRSIDTCLQTGTAFTLLSDSAITSVSWNFGDPASGSGNTSTSLSPNHVFSGIGNYTVSAVVLAPCGSYTVTYPITIISCAAPVCQGIISGSDSCLVNGTSFAVVSDSAITAITWSFGDPASAANNTATAISPSHTFSAAGSYTVSAAVTASCGTINLARTLIIVNCDTTPGNCFLGLPNAFSPNGDGRNDFFQPISSCTPEQFKFNIFNRWGELIYSTNNPLAKWDGTYKGSACPVDVYVYLVDYKLPLQNPQKIKGSVTLLK